MDWFTTNNLKPYLNVVASCQDCDGDIYEGEEVVDFEDYFFCNKECLAEYLLGIGKARYKDAE